MTMEAHGSYVIDKTAGYTSYALEKFNVGATQKTINVMSAKLKKQIRTVWSRRHPLVRYGEQVEIVSKGDHNYRKKNILTHFVFVRRLHAKVDTPSIEIPVECLYDDKVGYNQGLSYEDRAKATFI